MSLHSAQDAGFSTAEVQLRQLLQRQQLLAEITQRIRRSLRLEDVLRTAVEEVRQLLQTDRVLLYQFTSAEWHGKIAVESVDERFTSLIGMAVQDECFRQDHAFQYQQGRVRAIDDVDASDLTVCHRDFLAGCQVRANLVVPVLHNEELWGLLIAHHCESVRTWQDWEVDLLRQLSTIIAIAIQQASLVDQLQSQLAERDAMAQALQNSRERLRAVVSNAPIALIATDAQGIVLLSSGITLERLGREAKDLIGTSVFEGYEHIPELVSNIQRALTGETLTSTIEYGDYIFECRCSPKLDAAGTLQGAICVATDVTEQRQIENVLRQSEILRQSEAKNRALLDAIPDAILRIQQDGTCLDFKPSKSGQWIIPATSLGQPLSNILPVEIAQRFMEYLQRALETTKAQVFDYQLQHEQPIDYEARIVVNGTDEVLAIIRDISERKKVERLKNEFVSTVSHELRTPLTSIRGSLGLIRGGVTGEVSREAQELLDIAYKNSERLILLINDILDIEKIESGKMNFTFKPVELMPLVEQAIAANSAYAEQFHVSLALTQSLPGVQVNVDSQRFIQVLTNLLSNAAKFSPAGETVSICVTQRANRVRVSVQDQGPGIPPEFRDRIFQKFAQEDSSDARQKGGTGLGLSIAKAIMERLDGQLGFETDTQIGTTFYCDLPIWAPPVYQFPTGVDALSTTQVAGPDQPCIPARILVCEDDPDIALLLRIMMQQAGFVVDVASDAEVAKRLLSENRYQVMTLDLALPGQDGLSLIRELRSQDQTRLLPIIVVSAKAQQGREQLGGGFAVVDWLEKPINETRLIAVCKQAVIQNRDAKPKILHIEDNGDVSQIVSMLLKQEADICHAVNLQQAQHQLKTNTFDLIILDVSLPDGSGLDLLPFVDQKTGLPIPVVLFSAHEVSPDTAHKVAAALVKTRTSNQELLSTIKTMVTYCQYEEEKQCQLQP